MIEAAPAAAFESIVEPAIEKGRSIITASVGALLQHPHLIDLAQAKGAHLLVPSGALAGLDAVRAVALASVSSITLETRKPPASLAGAPYLLEHGIDLCTVREPTCVFRGDAMQAAQGFHGECKRRRGTGVRRGWMRAYQVEVWADPNVTRNTHIVRVDSDAAKLTITVESTPSGRTRVRAVWRRYRFLRACTGSLQRCAQEADRLSAVVFSISGQTEVRRDANRCNW